MKKLFTFKLLSICKIMFLVLAMMVETTKGTSSLLQYSLREIESRTQPKIYLTAEYYLSNNADDVDYDYGLDNLPSGDETTSTTSEITNNNETTNTEEMTRPSEEITTPPSDNWTCGVANPEPTSPSPSPKIVGGYEASPNEFPWHAFITTDNGSLTCGGSLIDDHWVLTSASCLIGRESVVVYLGVHKLNDPSELSRQKYVSTTLYYHPSYNSYYKRNDIGLIKLPSAIHFTRDIRPVCLPSDSDPDHVADNVILTGWENPSYIPSSSTTMKSIPDPTDYATHEGTPETTPNFITETTPTHTMTTSSPSRTPNFNWSTINHGHETTNKFPDIPTTISMTSYSENSSNIYSLQKVNTTVISNSECAMFHGYIITPTILCSSGSEGRGVCEGDFGGPMNYRQSDGVWTQIGIASFRTGPVSAPNLSCDATVPYGFTRVRPFLSYIQFITSLPNQSPTTANPTVSTNLSTNNNSPGSSTTTNFSTTTNVPDEITTENQPSNAKRLEFMFYHTKIRNSFGLFQPCVLLATFQFLIFAMSV